MYQIVLMENRVKVKVLHTYSRERDAMYRFNKIESDNVFMSKKTIYKEKVLVDVCSGMKTKRPKLKQLFKLVSDHKINRVVIEYKDRLTRFMFEVFESFFNSYGVEIECVEEVFPKSFENELVSDMLSLLSSFSSRIYGKRSAENRRKRQINNDS